MSGCRSSLKILSLAAVLAAAGTHARAFGGPPPMPDWVVQAAAAPAPPAGDSRAIVLLDDTLLIVQPDGQVVERHRSVVKILRPSGREEAEPSAYYNKDEKLSYMHVWSIGPDGHQYAMKDNEQVDMGLPTENGAMLLYNDVRIRTAKPPGADPGGVVAYEYEEKGRPYVAEDGWGMQQDIPIANSSYELDLPQGWHYYAAWARHASLDPTEVSPNHWRWQVHNVPAIDLEGVDGAPAGQALAGRMAVHYAATELPQGDARWAAIGDWYQTLNASRSEAPGDIADKARSLAAGSAGFMDKLQRVADFMQRDVRYVAVEVGIGGWQAHPAADTFHRRYGDCKDKATLLIAMLDSVGVRATWVLVDTDRGFVDPAAPSIYGNHMITAIEIPAGVEDKRLRSVVTAKNGRRYLIFDPTDELTPVGLLHHELQGTYGVLVAGGESQIIQLPQLDPADATASRTATFSLDENGTLKGTVKESRSGDLAWAFRSVYKWGDSREQREFLEHRLHDDFSSVTLDSSAVENVTDLDRNLVLNYGITAPGYARMAGDLLLVRPRVVGVLSHPVDKRPRLYPLELGATGVWRDDYSVKLPPGFAVDDLPRPVSMETDFATYHSEVKAEGDALHYTREYVIKDLELKPERYGDWKKLEAVITTDENSRAVLKRK